MHKVLDDPKTPRKSVYLCHDPDIETDGWLFLDTRSKYNKTCHGPETRRVCRYLNALFRGVAADKPSPYPSTREKKTRIDA
jgi:hypothetical protein